MCCCRLFFSLTFLAFAFGKQTFFSNSLERTFDPLETTNSDFADLREPFAFGFLPVTEANS